MQLLEQDSTWVTIFLAESQVVILNDNSCWTRMVSAPIGLLSAINLSAILVCKNALRLWYCVFWKVVCSFVYCKEILMIALPLIAWPWLRLNFIINHWMTIRWIPTITAIGRHADYGALYWHQTPHTDGSDYLKQKWCVRVGAVKIVRLHFESLGTTQLIWTSASWHTAKVRSGFSKRNFLLNRGHWLTCPTNCFGKHHIFIDGATFEVGGTRFWHADLCKCKHVPHR